MRNAAIFTLALLVATAGAAFAAKSSVELNNITWEEDQDHGASGTAKFSYKEKKGTTKVQVAASGLTPGANYRLMFFGGTTFFDATADAAGNLDASEKVAGDWVGVPFIIARQTGSDFFYVVFQN